MELCLGTVQFGMDYGVQGASKPSYEQVYEIFENALYNGINTFDTATLYGDAEEVLGSCIRYSQFNKDELRIISKLPGDAFDTEPDSRWKKIALSYAEDSLNKLCIKNFESYLFHDATMLYNKEAIRALYEVKMCGLSKKIGVSVYSPEEALQALDIDEIEVVQIPYNVFDYRLDRIDFFEIARKKGVEVYARSSLLQGLVAMLPEELPTKMMFVKPYLERYRNICNRYDISPVRCAVSYVFQRKDIDYLVFGVDTVDQLNEYIDYCGTKIMGELIKEIDQTFEYVDEKLVNPALWKI